MGNRRKLVVGKKADPLTVRMMLEALGRDANGYEVEGLSKRLQELAWTMRRSIEVSEVEQLLVEEDVKWKTKTF